MTKWTIEKAKELSDSELDTMLGFEAKRDEFKSTIESADKLEGGKRDDFERELNRTLNPTVYVEGLKYDVDRLARKSSSCCDHCSVAGVPCCH